MSRGLPCCHRSALVPAAAIVIAGGLLGRRLGRRSGVSDAEVAATLPGDELVPRPMWASTRGIGIAVAPTAVWPWIVQMGYPTRRGGWYTPRWLDRLQWGIRAGSAERIVPELQHLAPGDVVPDSDDGSAFFTVAAVDPPHALVLHSTRHLLPPVRAVSFSWAFVLRDDAGGGTRLLMRARVTVAPPAARALLWLVIGPGDALNASVMLRGIRARAEQTTEVPASAT